MMQTRGKRLQRESLIVARAVYTTIGLLFSREKSQPFAARYLLLADGNIRFPFSSFNPALLDS